MSVTEKFQKYLPLLKETIQESIFLDLKNPKLYKKLVRYYASIGVKFYDDPIEDYTTLVECLKNDLTKVAR